MAEDDSEFRGYAAPMYFPRRLEDLTGTGNCPACFARLTGEVCDSCRLDLNHPAASRLHDVSLAAANALELRASIVGRMRFETAQRGAELTLQGAQAVAQPIAVPVASTETAASPAGATSSTAIAEPAAEEPAFTPPQPPVTPPPPASGTPGGNFTIEPRRSSVQVTLLLVGVTLLSVAAIFFLVYAFINFGLIWRSVIIGGITVAALVAAHLLRVKGLRATAEGIAAFAVVLVYLDAWAVRENDLFGLGSGHGAIHWGVTFVATSIAFALWSRASTLRTPGIVGHSVFVPGIMLLAAGITDELVLEDGTFIAFSAGAIAGFSQLLAPHRVERVIVLIQTSLAVAGAAFAGLFVGDPAIGPAVALAVVALVAGAHVYALAQLSARAEFRGFGYGFSLVAGIVAAGFMVPLDTGWDPFSYLVPPVTAVAVAVGLDGIRSKLPEGYGRRSLLLATVSAGAVALLVLALPVGVSAFTVLVTVASAIFQPWDNAAIDTIYFVGDELGWAVLGLAIATALAGLLWGVARMLGRRLVVVAWAAVIALLLAVPLLSTVWMVLAGWLAIAVVALGLLLLNRGERIRGPLVAALATAGTIGYLFGWVSIETWWASTIVALALLIGVRMLVARPARAAIAAVIAALVIGSAAAVAAHITFGSGVPDAVDAAGRIRFAGLAAVVVFAGAAFPNRLVSPLERRAVFWVSGALIAMLVGSTPAWLERLSAAERGLLLLPEYWTGLGVALLLLAGIALWLRRVNRVLKVERIVASVGIGPALYLAVTSFALALGLVEFSAAVAPISAALLAAAGSLVVRVLGRSTLPRWARDVGVAIVAVPALGWAVWSNADAGWLVLALGGVTALLLAIDTDGLFGSQSQRRHFGWLALTLATGGLWWRLSADAVSSPEPYLLPLAGALIVVGILVHRARGASVAAPLIALGGALVAILPLAFQYATGDPMLAIVLFAVSTALLLAGSFLRGGSPAWLDAAAAAGAIGVAVTAIGRAAEASVLDVARDVWLAGMFLVLLVAAIGLGLRASGDRLRTLAANGLVIFAMAAVLLIELTNLPDTRLGAVRAMAIVVTFAAVHVLSFLGDRVPFTPVVGWSAIGFALIGALLALQTVEPVEILFVPIALALLVTGANHLNEVATARSWPWLGPGTGILLLPSLIATVDDRPMWRLVGLGVVGVAVIVVGVAKRLQAPFTIGVVVVLIHGIATFLPQLRAAYEFFPWWLWLGAGGVLLIVLAARYEQRIANFKAIALKFSNLR
ncbi:hypothetical protein [Cryobacterium sp. BB307]|uniref:SCO7613 C-terminal domain-containing membrane protein n=1 Tax=Cryobacterium sp. BB307 TaxID=2716317 RepID=UPI00144715AE|nr:hypothetical protein [Cryobacterium sp. BB307]